MRLDQREDALKRKPGPLLLRRQKALGLRRGKPCRRREGLQLFDGAKAAMIKIRQCHLCAGFVARDLRVLLPVRLGRGKLELLLCGSGAHLKELGIGRSILDQPGQRRAHLSRRARGDDGAPWHRKALEEHVIQAAGGIDILHPLLKLGPDGNRPAEDE